MSDNGNQVVIEGQDPALPYVRSYAWQDDGSLLVRAGTIQKEVATLQESLDRLRATAREVSAALTEGPLSWAERHALAQRLRQTP